MADNKGGRKERDWGDLTIEELEREGALELPDREALSTLAPRLPVDPSLLPAFQPDSPAHDDEVGPEGTRDSPDR